MYAVSTMKRPYDAISVPRHLSAAHPTSLDDVDVMIMAHERKQKQEGNRRKRRRTVRFSEQADEKHDVIVDDSTWLSKEELQQIRDGARRDIRADAFLSAISPKTLLNETVYSGTEVRDDEIPQHEALGEAKSKEILNRLTQWTQYVDSRRGLENQVNKRLGKARRKHRERAIRAVIIGQRVARQRKHNVETRELLRRLSQKYSLLAKNHALLMGKADEKAASYLV